MDEKANISKEKGEKEEKARFEKKALQARLALEAEQRQKLEEIQKSPQKKRLLKENTPEYGFDMLCSGDSTDDEDEENRPSPPEWSTAQNISKLIDQQSNICTEIVDTFFGVTPSNTD